MQNRKTHADAPRLGDLAGLFRSYRWGLVMALRAAPRLAALWLVMLLFNAGLMPGMLLLVRRTLRLLEHGEVAQAWPWALGLALVLLLQTLAGSALRYVRNRLAAQVQEQVQQRLHEQAGSLPLSFFDQNASYDQLHRARADAAQQPLQLLEQTGSFIQNLLVFTAVGLVLAQYRWWMPVLLVVSGVPALVFAAQRALAAHRLNRRLTPLQRQAQHYSAQLTIRESAAELRLFGLMQRFLTRRAELRQTIIKAEAALERDELYRLWAAGTLGWLGIAACLLWLLNQMAHAEAGVADLVVSYQAFVMGQRLLMSTLESAGALYRASIFLGDLRMFLALPPEAVPQKPQAFPSPLNTGIRLEHVGFCYPGTKQPALSDLSMMLPAGRITAIVGLNGAGKSTLVRLLCGLYTPSSGRIHVDDVDLANIPPAVLRAQLSVLFQDAMRYQTTARDNIGCADPEADDSALRAAAWAATADVVVGRMSAGLDTELGKLRGGVDLSGGEWQRLALARAMLRDSPILLLDEPTSAMDSWTEADWFSRLRQHTAGRTVILITHRFNAARQADYINVMDGGRLLESGTHDELLATGGAYAVAWREQSRAYSSVESGGEAGEGGGDEVGAAEFVASPGRPSN